MMDIGSCRLSVCLSNVSQFWCFNKTREVFFQVFSILALASFPINAFAQCDVSGDIPFKVSNFASGGAYCVLCGGPWARATPLFRVPKQIGRAHV